VRYWVSVQAHTPDFTVFWGCRGGTADDSRSVQFTQVNTMNVFNTDRAFALIGP
jgi:hypothetical protein